MKILSRQEVADLLKEGLEYLVQNNKSELFEQLLDHIHVAKSRMGAMIITITGPMLQNPENQAMLASLNSRSAGGFFKNINKVLKGNAEKFMEIFFVNYSHKSIGDCGVIAMWIDGLSMVATKQFESWPLYSGQETSTRYVDVTGVGVMNPITLMGGSKEAALALDSAYDRLFDFYKKALPRMDVKVRERFPFVFDSESKKTETEQKENYDNTVLAKCCDILGAYLPCGTRTNMSIIMNLRQMSELFEQMSHDPLEEVSWIAQDCRDFLAGFYSALVPRKVTDKNRTMLADQAKYWKGVRRKTGYYLYNEYPAYPKKAYPDYQFESFVDFDWNEWAWALENRPEHCELPKETRKFGNFRVTHLQDYRSMRDGYRHRDGTNRVPCAVMHYGFEKWYEDQVEFDLPLFKEAELVLSEIKEFHSQAVSAMSNRIEGLLLYQYVVPMGYKQPCERTITFASMVYYVELRTGKRVHPTERSVALKVTKSLRELYPKLVLHVDEEPSDWDLRRGGDVITLKVQ